MVEMEWTIPEMVPGLEAEHQLAISGMMHVDPTLILEEVTQKVVHRHEAERWCPDVDDEDLEVVVRENLLQGEQDEALRELTRRKSNVTAASIKSDVKKSYQKSSEAVDPGRWRAADARRRAKEKDAENRAKQNGKMFDRVYNKLSSSIDERMRVLLPPVVNVYTDPKNGRWRMNYRNAVIQVARSISWTMIGERTAACEVVRQAWSWAEQHEGSAAPDNLETKLDMLAKNDRGKKTS